MSKGKNGTSEKGDSQGEIHVWKPVLLVRRSWVVRRKGSASVNVVSLIAYMYLDYMHK